VNSRYLNVLRMSFLGSDIPFDCALAYRPDTGDVVAPRPHARKSGFEPRKFFSKLVRSKPFELGCNLGGSKGRVALDKNVNVVGHYLKGMYRGFEFLSFLVKKNLESCFQLTRKKLLTVFWAPHKVILKRENGASVGLISWVRHLINSTYIIPPEVGFCQIFIERGASASSAS